MQTDFDYPAPGPARCRRCRRRTPCWGCSTRCCPRWSRRAPSPSWRRTTWPTTPSRTLVAAAAALGRDASGVEDLDAGGHPGQRGAGPLCLRAPGDVPPPPRGDRACPGRAGAKAGACGSRHGAAAARRCCATATCGRRPGIWRGSCSSPRASLPTRGRCRRPSRCAAAGGGAGGGSAGAGLGTGSWRLGAAACRRLAGRWIVAASGFCRLAKQVRSR